MIDDLAYSTQQPLRNQLAAFFFLPLSLFASSQGEHSLHVCGRRMVHTLQVGLPSASRSPGALQARHGGKRGAVKQRCDRDKRLVNKLQTDASTINSQPLNQHNSLLETV